MAQTGKPDASKESRPRKTPPTLAERVKTQLTVATLRGGTRISAEELGMLETHIGKLKTLLSKES